MESLDKSGMSEPITSFCPVCGDMLVISQITRYDLTEIIYFYCLSCKHSHQEIRDGITIYKTEDGKRCKECLNAKIIN
jgi:formate dehydrogenase maturation protein FdhE